MLDKTKKLLDNEILARNTIIELTYDKPDPLMVAKRYDDEYIALICALFAYGNAKQIVKFLDSLDFGLLDKSEDEIRQKLSSSYYRFQNSDDVIAIFIALNRLKKVSSLEDIFYERYKNSHNILDGIEAMIEAIKDSFKYESDGYKFLISNNLLKDKNGNYKLNISPYKRYNMFLRWVVRSDNLDMGLWSKIDKKDLILPLDTHTFKVSQKLGLLGRKSYDLKSAILITEALKGFDKNDPIKYDFALYRIGQEGII
jgi:uncharacterized protein (TIGR02757 family)